MIQCQGCTCAGWLWEGEGGLGDHQPGVYVPLKALFLVVLVVILFQVQITKASQFMLINEPMHQKTNNLYMRKQRRRSAVQCLHS